MLRFGAWTRLFLSCFLDAQKTELRYSLSWVLRCSLPRRCSVDTSLQIVRGGVLPGCGESNVDNEGYDPDC